VIKRGIRRGRTSTAKYQAVASERHREIMTWKAHQAINEGRRAVRREVECIIRRRRKANRSVTRNIGRRQIGGGAIKRHQRHGVATFTALDHVALAMKILSSSRGGIAAAAWNLRA